MAQDEEQRPPEGAEESQPRGRRMPPWLPVALVFVALCGVVGWLLLGGDASDAFAYKRSVDEVMADPGSFADRQLRVEGELRQGSIRFREDPCEWRFVLASDDHEMSVRFPQCVVPDTFRDGMGISVVVQGHIGGDGVFLANQVVPKCPSKYEEQEQMQNGGEIPHSLTGPTPENT